MKTFDKKILPSILALIVALSGCGEAVEKANSACEPYSNLYKAISMPACKFAVKELDSQIAKLPSTKFNSRGQVLDADLGDIQVLVSKVRAECLYFFPDDQYSCDKGLDSLKQAYIDIDDSRRHQEFIKDARGK